MAKTVLITGANGQLGNEMRLVIDGNDAFSPIFTDVQELDITSKDAIDAFFANHHIDYVVNCAAYTAVDNAEDNVELCTRLNADAVEYLAQAENEKATSGSGSNEKLYSFEKDDTLIFSAFYRTYKIDIEAELDTLHWWKFMAMFNDLDEKSKLVGVYMYYRGLDINESSIYKHASEREKQKILEMKNFVSLESKNIGSSVGNAEKEKIRLERLKILEAKNGNGN